MGSKRSPCEACYSCWETYTTRFHVFFFSFFLGKVGSTTLMLHTKLQARSIKNHLHAMAGDVHVLVCEINLEVGRWAGKEQSISSRGGEQRRCLVEHIAVIGRVKAV